LGSYEDNTGTHVIKNRLKHMIKSVSKQFNIKIIQENSNEQNGNQYSNNKRIQLLNTFHKHTWSKFKGLEYSKR